MSDEAPVEPEAPSGYWHSLTHPSRRGWMLIIGAGTTLLLLAVAFVLPVPFVKLAPGPTFNVIGDNNGEPVIQISGTQTFPTTGNLNMVTVLESGGPRGGLTFVDAIASWLNPSDAVIPRELLFPDDQTGEEVVRNEAVSFSSAESNAIGAAMSYLKKPLTVQIVANPIYTNSPSDGVLQPKDELLAIDGKPITDPAQVADAIRSQPIGTTFEFTIKRNGVEQKVSVTSAARPEDPSAPYIGIGVQPFYAAEFPIAFTLDDIGGPSAGLMFATGIVDKLTPDDLAKGQHIAGTGTIAPDGTVGPIGGIRQKLAGARNDGATLFLMPEAHCEEAADHVPDGLTVVPVKTLSDAIDAIRAYTEGKPVATCPAPVS